MCDKLYASYQECGNTLYTSLIWSLFKLQFRSSSCCISHSGLIQPLDATSSSSCSGSNLTLGPGLGCHSSTTPAQNAMSAPSPSDDAMVLLSPLRMPPRAFSVSTLGSLSSPGPAQAIFRGSGSCSVLAPAQAPTQLCPLLKLIISCFPFLTSNLALALGHAAIAAPPMLRMSPLLHLLIEIHLHSVPC